MPAGPSGAKAVATAKDHAIALYMEAIRDGDARAALDAHIGARYTQHSTGVKDGKEGFLGFFEPFLERNPVRHMEVRRALQDGRHVFLHVYQNLNDGAAEWTTADFFDSDEDGRIVEHWDVIAPYAGDTLGRTNIDGPADLADLDRTATNKALVSDFVATCLVGGATDKAGNYLAEAAQADGGAALGEGLRTVLAGDAPGAAAPRHLETVLTVGEGNFVATLNRTVLNGAEQCHCDVFRVDLERIVEHWELAEPVPPQAEWANSGKF